MSFGLKLTLETMITITTARKVILAHMLIPRLRSTLREGGTSYANPGTPPRIPLRITGRTGA